MRKTTIIENDFQVEEIVICLCGAKNRVHVKTASRKIRCGRVECHRNLENPFVVPVIEPSAFSKQAGNILKQAGRWVILIFISIIAAALLTLIAVNLPENKPKPVPSRELFSENQGTLPDLPYVADPNWKPKDEIDKFLGPDPIARALNNGEIIYRSPVNGNCDLTVENGTKYDAVLKLIDEYGSTVVSFYIQHGKTAKVDKIKDSNCTAIFEVGNDWDSGAGYFTRSERFSKFDKLLNFTTIRDSSGGYQYSTVSMTLQGVLNGNARTSRISKKDFLSH